MLRGGPEEQGIQVKAVLLEKAPALWVHLGGRGLHMQDGIGQRGSKGEQPMVYVVEKKQGPG